MDRRGSHQQTEEGARLVAMAVLEDPVSCLWHARRGIADHARHLAWVWALKLQCIPEA
jgi:hypothetical protein